MNNDYALSIASLEIIALITGAFIAGALFCSLLKLLGLCCRRPKRTAEPVYHSATTPAPAAAAPAYNQVSTEPEPTAEPDSPRMMPASGDSSFEADIQSLIRSSNSQIPPAPETPPPPSTVANSYSFEERIRDSLPAASRHMDSGVDTLEIPGDDHVDDLKKLEGIGPRIEKLLNNAGIRNYAQLATMDRDRLREILLAGGREFKMHEPKSWPYQAELAAKNNWDRLKEYQDFLLEGRNQ